MNYRSAFFLVSIVWIVCLVAVACQQRTKNLAPVEFTALLRRFKQQGLGAPLLPGPIIYRHIAPADGQLQYELQLAGKPLRLQNRVAQLRGQGYPVSYSVVFKNCLVPLFRDGKFGCYKLADLTTDQQLERMLNTRRWNRHWLINKQLVAQSGHRYFVFAEATQNWQPYTRPVPFGPRAKLYEDARYLAYSDCEGEWGGTVYFFNKATCQVHRANATCANSVWQQDGQYWLLASLGHGDGSAACAIIANPEELPLASTPRNDRVNWQYDFKLPEKGVKQVFDFYGVELFSGFRWQNQTLYLMYWRNTTFLVAIADSRITIVDPLFANDLFTHNPVTTTYAPGLAVTNLDFDGLGGRDEVTTLLWQGSQLTKIEWGEQANEVK